MTAKRWYVTCLAGSAVALIAYMLWTLCLMGVSRLTGDFPPWLTTATFIVAMLIMPALLILIQLHSKGVGVLHRIAGSVLYFAAFMALCWLLMLAASVGSRISGA